MNKWTDRMDIPFRSSLHKQVWLWPNKAPGIVGSVSYDINIQ